jgi:3-isopropylmalate/(R)-2-methylmalate dehydratase small subunit
MKEKIIGRVYVVGDDVNTDVIIPARYLTTMDPVELKKHLFEDLPNKSPYNGETILLAGRNFGCGSSREHAPIAIAAAGIEAVVASSFARIYWRNSINAGKPLPLKLTFKRNLEKIFMTGDEAEIKLQTDGWYALSVFSNGEWCYPYSIEPFATIPREILEAGGLTEYNKKRLGL